MDAKAIFTTVAVMVFANGAVLATVYRDLPATLRPAAARWQIGTVLVTAGCAIFAFGSFLPMPIMVALANFVLSIIGAIKSNGGNAYRYPFVLRLVK